MLLTEYFRWFAALGIFGTCCCILSCEETSTVSGSGTAPPLYPMAVGNHWEYEQTAYWHNIRVIDSSAYTPADTFRSDHSVRVLRMLYLPSGMVAGGDSVLVSELRTQSTTEFAVESFRYYESTSDQLLIHGYDGSAGFVTPRVEPENISFVFNGCIYGSLSDLLSPLGIAPRGRSGDLIREIPPLTVLSYPLTVGKQWTYRDDGQPLRIDKLVEAPLDTVLNGLPERLTVVRWLYDINHDGEWDEDISIFDFYGRAGLTIRVLELKNVGFTSSQSPDPFAYADMCDVTVLRGVE